MSVCLSVRDHIIGTTRPIFTKCFVHLIYGCGSVLLWGRSDMLRTSGLMDDVIFAHNRPKPVLLDVSAGSEAHTQFWAWRLGIPVAGSGRSGLLLAARAYLAAVCELNIYDIIFAHPAYIATCA